MELNNLLTFVVLIIFFRKIKSANGHNIMPPMYLDKNGRPDNNPLLWISIPCTFFIYVGVFVSNVNIPQVLAESVNISPINGTEVTIDFHGIVRVFSEFTDFLSSLLMYSRSSLLILGCVSGVSNTKILQNINHTTVIPPIT